MKSCLCEDRFLMVCWFMVVLWVKKWWKFGLCRRVCSLVNLSKIGFGGGVV